MHTLTHSPSHTLSFPLTYSLTLPHTLITLSHSLTLSTLTHTNSCTHTDFLSTRTRSLSPSNTHSLTLNNTHTIVHSLSNFPRHLSLCQRCPFTSRWHCTYASLPPVGNVRGPLSPGISPLTASERANHTVPEPRCSPSRAPMEVDVVCGVLSLSLSRRRLHTDWRGQVCQRAAYPHTVVKRHAR